MTYYAMIKESLLSLKERNGSSLPAIKKYIETNHSDVNFQPHQLKAALKKGVELGKLIKIKASYKLSPDEKKPVRKTAVAKKAAPAKKAPAKKAAPAKKKATVKKTPTKKPKAKTPTKKPKAKTPTKKKPAKKPVAAKKKTVTKKKVVKKKTPTKAKK